MRFLMIIVLCSICSLNGAALPEQPVRDIKTMKLYAAICAKVQQHLISPLAEIVAEYCDNDFPLVQKTVFSARAGISCANFFDDRYLLVGQKKSTNLTLVDTFKERKIEIETRHQQPLAVVCRVCGDVVATGSPEGIYFWDIKKKTVYQYFRDHNYSGMYALFSVGNDVVARVYHNRVYCWNWRVRDRNVDCYNNNSVPHADGSGSYVTIHDVQGNVQALGNNGIDKMRFTYSGHVLTKDPCEPSREGAGFFRIYQNGSGAWAQIAGPYFWIDGVYIDNNQGPYFTIGAEENDQRALYHGRIRHAVVSPSEDALALITEAYRTGFEEIRIFRQVEEKGDGGQTEQFWAAVEQKPRKKKHDWCACS